jgi:hypothetical protein
MNRHLIHATVLATLTALNASMLQAEIVTNGGFETPTIPHGTTTYRPTGATWEFTGFSGITHEDSNWPAPPSVDGSQIAFLQVLTNPANSYITQTITLPDAGWYCLTYHSAGRGRAGHPGNLGFDFLLDGVRIGSGSTYNAQPFTKHSFDFLVSHAMTAEFRIVATSFAGIDTTAFFDAIEIVACPEPSSVALASLCILSFGSKNVRRVFNRKQRMSKGNGGVRAYE